MSLSRLSAAEIFYHNLRALSRMQVRYLNVQKTRTQPELRQYVVFSCGGVQPFRGNLDKSWITCCFLGTNSTGLQNRGGYFQASASYSVAFLLCSALLASTAVDHQGCAAVAFFFDTEVRPDATKDV